MNKKYILISFLILIVGLLVVFIYYRQSLPKKTTPVAYEDLHITSEEGCKFNDCCPIGCDNIGEEPEMICVTCGNVPKYYTKGNNRCVKNSEDRCVLDLSLTSKFYKFYYKLFNL